MTTAHQDPSEIQDSAAPSPTLMLTYAEAAALLRIDKRTLRRRIAGGRYKAYGEGAGRRVVYSSILADIRRECGEVL